MLCINRLRIICFSNTTSENECSLAAVARDGMTSHVWNDFTCEIELRRGSISVLLF